MNISSNFSKTSGLSFTMYFVRRCEVFVVQCWQSSVQDCFSVIPGFVNYSNIIFVWGNLTQRNRWFIQLRGAYHKSRLSDSGHAASRKQFLCPEHLLPAGVFLSDSEWTDRDWLIAPPPVRGLLGYLQRTISSPPRLKYCNGLSKYKITNFELLDSLYSQITVFQWQIKIFFPTAKSEIVSLAPLSSDSC
jgi:hypothetical protein